MKMKTGIRMLFVLMLAAALAVAASAAGETVISDAASLAALMADSSAWSGSYRLGADIDLSGILQSPIGTYETPFSGSFDGDGHTVKVSIKADGTVGLFGVAEGATIRSLTVDGSVVNTFAATDAETKLDEKYPGTGALCGVILSGTTVENCTVRAAVSGPGNVGGLVGVIYNFDAKPVMVKGCTGEAKITSTCGNAGGLIGRIQTGSAASPAVLVSSCANRADVTSTSEDRNRLAGIAGYVRSQAGEIRIEACENTGKIIGANSGTKAANCPFVGGIAGRIEIVADATSAVRVLNCKNTGAIESTHHAGGIAAYINRSDKATGIASEIIGCLNTGAVSGPSHAGGIVGYTENRCGADVRSAVKDCENCGAVASSACAGGIVGRWYGFDILTSFNSGKVTADSLVGGIAGKAEGAIFCETNAAYLAGTADAAVGESNPVCVELGAIAVPAADAAKRESFAGFDFASVWKTGKNGPTLAAFADGKQPQVTTAAPVETVVPTETTASAAESAAVTADSTQATADTEAADTTVASDAADTTAEPAASQDTMASEPEKTAASAATSASTAETPEGEESGVSAGLVIGIVIAAFAIGAAVVIFLVRKKKRAE